MMGHTALTKMKTERGPRHLVYGTVRQGEYVANYASTPERADALQERYREAGYYTITVVPPEQCDDLAVQVRELGRKRRAAADVERDLSEQLRAATLALIAAGASEVSAADSAGVTRMTIRSWQGKR